MQPDHDEVEIRPYRPGDEAALVALFAEVFGKPCSLEWWRWKLKGQPSPVENVWVATAGERVVGQYAGIPVRVRAGGAVCPAMVSVDTMTSPDFRRRGILSRLGAAVYEAWATAGVVAVIGLPNEQWGSRTGALGWVGVEPLAWMRFPLNVGQAAARRVPSPLSAPAHALNLGGHVWRLAHRPLGARGVKVEAVATPGSEFDTLWGTRADRAGVGLVRDRAWAAWRYFDAPGMGYRVLLAREGGAPTGYIAYRPGGTPERRIGYIADHFADHDGGSARVLLAAALDDLAAGGVEKALALTVPGSPAERVWWAGGFLPTRNAFDFAVVPLRPDLVPADLTAPGIWHLAGGDFDVV